MPYPSVSKAGRVAIVGCGTIGASWSAWFLAKGLRVSCWDPAADAEPFTRRYVETAWPVLERLGVTEGRSIEEALGRLSQHDKLGDAVVGADFVQENAPERLEVKQQLLRDLDTLVPADRIIASSTSGFTASELQRDMQAPERLVVGHPFNPPHLIPLVEVVGGARTSPDAVAWALDFYKAVGKRPIHVRKEVPGHVSNRLQVALWREAIHLVAEGVASVEDVDAAISEGPGLRWAIMGPHLTFHLGGGEGGMAHFVDHLGPPITGWWKSLGDPALTPEIKAKLVEGVTEEMGQRDQKALMQERDEKLVRILAALNDQAEA